MLPAQGWPASSGWSPVQHAFFRLAVVPISMQQGTVCRNASHWVTVSLPHVIQVPRSLPPDDSSNALGHLISSDQCKKLTLGDLGSVTDGNGRLLLFHRSHSSISLCRNQFICSDHVPASSGRARTARTMPVSKSFLCHCLLVSGSKPSLQQSAKPLFRELLPPPQPRASGGTRAEMEPSDGTEVLREARHSQ